MITIARYTGETLNGGELEYLHDGLDRLKVFHTKGEAIDYLKENYHNDMTDREIEEKYHFEQGDSILGSNWGSDGW